MMIGEKEKKGVNGGNWVLITLVTGYGFSHPTSTRQTVTVSECGRVGGLGRGWRGVCDGVGGVGVWEPVGWHGRVKSGQPRPLTAHFAGEAESRSPHAPLARWRELHGKGKAYVWCWCF